MFKKQNFQGYNDEIDKYFGSIVKNYDQKIESAQAVVDTVQQYVNFLTFIPYITLSCIWNKYSVI